MRRASHPLHCHCSRCLYVLHARLRVPAAPQPPMRARIPSLRPLLDAPTRGAALAPVARVLGLPAARPKQSPQRRCRPPVGRLWSLSLLLASPAVCAGRHARRKQRHRAVAVDRRAAAVPRASAVATPLPAALTGRLDGQRRPVAVVRARQAAATGVGVSTRRTRRGNKDLGRSGGVPRQQSGCGQLWPNAMRTSHLS